MSIERKDIYFLGDIHGHWKWLTAHVELVLQNTNIIQVGDFGVGYLPEVTEKYYLTELDNSLSNNNSKLFVVRGNHDDPSYFDEHTKPRFYKNIHFITDYTVLHLEGYIILCVGGAISIDREWSKENNKPYWTNEVFKCCPELIKRTDIDVVVTHSAPGYVYPISSETSNLVQQFARHDSNLVYELVAERKEITRLFDFINNKNTITHHFYGHFHQDHIDIIDDTKHVLLGCNSLYELKRKEL